MTFSYTKLCPDFMVVVDISMFDLGSRPIKPQEESKNVDKIRMKVLFMI
jgi:hypothetical protein